MLAKIFAHARMHTDSGTVISIPHKIDVVFMSVLTEIQRRIEELESTCASNIPVLELRVCLGRGADVVHPKISFVFIISFEIIPVVTPQAAAGTQDPTTSYRLQKNWSSL
jgi:hypothetical protein